MTRVDGALAEAGRLRARFVGETGYALVYGSHATGSAGDSDLDLLFVGPPLPASDVDHLVNAVVALHHEHRLRLDTEVAYEMKLHATPVEVRAALSLRGFVLDVAGNVDVPPVIVAPWFLNSTAFKLRLILNALTTPHMFLGGAIDLYRRHCAGADRAVALVALSLLDSSVAVTMADAVAALVTAADGSTGEDFLGYDQGPAVYSTVHRGLAHLIGDHVVWTVDGVCFHQDSQRRRALVAGLGRPDAKRSSGPGTIEQVEQGGCQLE